MAFPRPTLTELIDRIEADFISRLQLTSAPLRRSVVRIFARVLAGVAHGLYGLLSFLAAQLFADTSVAEYLARQGSLFIGAKIAAGYAQATATATGADGTLISAGAVLVRSDGATYTVDASVTIASGTAALALTAVDAGAAGTLSAAVVLSFESPISGADSSVTVAASTTDGSDEETDEEYRERLKERFLNAPGAGTSADYVRWAKAVSGVTRVWPVANGLGAGTVLVRFVRDNDAGSIIPDAGEVAAVQAYLNGVAPITAAVTVAAPTAVPINFTLHLVPDTSDTRAAAQAEIADLLQRTTEPGGTTYLTQLDLAVAGAAGLTTFSRSAPSADITPSAGQISTVGSFTWI